MQTNSQFDQEHKIHSNAGLLTQITMIKIIDKHASCCGFDISGSDQLIVNLPQLHYMGRLVGMLMDRWAKAKIKKRLSHVG